MHIIDIIYYVIYRKDVTILKNKNYPFIPDSYLKDNYFSSNESYTARNILSNKIYSSSVFAQETPPLSPEQKPENEQQPAIREQAPESGLPPGDIPAAPAEPSKITEEESEEVGYISVGVFTASGALPVEDAVVTVYTLDENNEENVITHLVTDANGQVPTIELPVLYDGTASGGRSYTTYNLRIQAINYYTVNILDFRVFPDITTNFTIDMIPVAAGPTESRPDMTFVIPPSPADISND
ncbi:MULTISPECIES: carboxypeptidase-like regulatory domain-containing protein [unclassified Sedimentibacter]|uniref:carboxypeptidase-like regulatory domain-containing protein n=1 Tax=unclassified Sedimentibacter TaxID=2649220 RepID=UPI0027DF6807|nr:carboxypeptidase-like regulatory domain-containing protein [Sedimentibacter sp. MB35-C1]WMJ78899.1 carboxypeptidase-like regulatory domain-containing protein [Sedimentibacter sp. MB35-C1]